MGSSLPLFPPLLLLVLGIRGQECASCCTTGTFLRIYVASYHGEQQTQSCWGGEGEREWVRPRRQQGWLWRGLSSLGGSNFPFPCAQPYLLLL